MIGSKRRERRLLVRAVGVGDLQLEARAALHHVGDAGGEHALLAGQLLVDEVGDAVRGGARLLARQRVGDAAEVRACFTVSKSLKRTSKRPSGRAATEPSTSASARRERHSGVVDGARPRSSGGSSGGTSSVRNRPLRSRSARTTAEMPAVPPSAPSPAKGAIAIGMRCAPAPVISIESCADAAVAKQSRQSREQLSHRAIIFQSFGRNVSSQLALEQRPAAVGLGQRRGLQDRALDRVVVAPLWPLDFVSFTDSTSPVGSCTTLNSASGLPLRSGRQHDVAADLGADLVHPGRQRLAVRARRLARQLVLDLLRSGRPRARPARARAPRACVSASRPPCGFGGLGLRPA